MCPPYFPPPSTSTGSSVPASYDLTNLGLAATVSANALTVALKQKDGSTDPASGTGAVNIGVRSATITSGSFNTRTVTAALSLTVASGATLGTVSGQLQNIWVYAIDNAGTIELAISSTKFSDLNVVTTTALSGASNSISIMYSTTARSNVPFRLIGVLTSNQTTAGTWAVVPSQTSVGDFGEIISTTNIESAWTTYTLTPRTSSSAVLPTFGTVVKNQAKWRRSGPNMIIEYYFDMSNAGTTDSGTFMYPLPSGYTMDTSSAGVVASTAGAGSVVGVGSVYLHSANPPNFFGWAVPYDASNICLVLIYTSNILWSGGYSVSYSSASGLTVTFQVSVPIVGWQAG